MRPIGYNSRTSWIVALGSSLIGFLLLIPMRLAGLLFIIIIDRYDTDRMIATIPITLFGMLRTLTGPFVGYLGQVFGLRRVTMSGCLMAAVGVGACFFAEGIYTVIVYLGLIYGVGFGLGSTLISEILKQHFSKDINLVNGLFVTGTCLGAIIMPQVVLLLIDKYGYSGMFLLLSGIILNTVPLTILFKDPKNDEYEAKLKLAETLNNQMNNVSQNINSHQNASFVSDNENLEIFVVEKQMYATNKFTNEFYETPYSELPKPITENNVAASNQSFTKVDLALKDGNLCSNVKLKDINGMDTKYTFNDLSKNNNSVRSVELLMFNRNNTLPNVLRKPSDTNAKNDKLGNDSKNHDIENCQKETDDASECTKHNKKDSRRTLFHLFLDPTFHLTMTVQSLHAFVSTLSWTILIDFARDRGIPPGTSVYFLMLLPLSEMFGSISLSWVSDRDYLTRTKYCMICFFILAAVSVCMVYTFNCLTMMVAVLLFGFISSSLTSTFPGMIHEFIEESQQGMALASRFMLYAFLCMTKSPIIGYFRGTLGSYDWVFFIIAACCTLSGILVTFTPVLATRRKNKQLRNRL